MTALLLITVGKGARNREQRRKQAAARDNFSELLDELLAVEQLEAFLDLITSHPEILSDEILSLLDPSKAGPVAGATFRPWRDLLRQARTDPRRAWKEFRRAIEELDDLGKELESQGVEIERALSERRFDEAIALADAGLEQASGSSLPLAVGLLHGQRASALLRTPNGDHAENLEQAIQSGELALAHAFDRQHAAQVAMNLAVACMDRVRGDRSENVDRAIGLLRTAISELDESSAPETRAIMQTNLATALLRRENGDRGENLLDAAALCREALKARSPERDAYDWAHTQLNLGLILQNLAPLGHAEMSEALDAFETVAGEIRLQGDQAQAGQQWIVGSAHFSIGQLQRIATEFNPEELDDPELADEVVDALESVEAQQEVEDLLRNSQAHLNLACELTHEAPDPMLRGRILDEFALVNARLGDDDEAIAAAREALTILRPTAAPRESVTAAGRLGGLLAERGEWEGAADAYRLALEAAELTYHARLEVESREAEARKAINLARWASYAQAAAGDPAEAALMLEGGRTRELRVRLHLEGGHSDEQLTSLPDQMRDAYIAAMRRVAVSPLRESGSEAAARELHELLAAIRELPGFDRFGTGTSADDLTSATEPGWPVVYINPTPNGTLLLRVSSEPDPRVVEAAFVDGVTSLDVLMRLLAGDRAESPGDEDSGEVASYLAGIGAFGEGELKHGLAQSLAWLGEAIARPLCDLLAESSSVGVTLIPCGPLGVAPLHAAPWRDEDGKLVCLLDLLPVRYAPSALIAGSCLRRAAERDRPACFVAVADPNGDLPATRCEVAEIARHFAGPGVVIAEGSDADIGFLRSNAEKASHLHLACHASGGLFDPMETGILLANGPLLAHELTALGELDARLAVVSACQSAVAEITHMPDEVFSISTAMLAAGSACAIASLWPVDDVATALLMTRLYEEMFEHGHRPPEALRLAQLWLRDLGEDGEAAFLANHPALEAELQRRRERGDPPGRRSRPGGEDSTTTLYSDPEYWAPFIAVGV